MKWSDKAILQNDHEIRFFSPNDAPLKRYVRLKFWVSDQGVISLEGAKLNIFSAIALTIRGLKFE